MTLWNDEQIDLIAKSPTGDATLFMVEERPWSEDEHQADQLIAKVNSYFTYVAAGKFATDYPELVGLPVVVRLECATEPTKEVQKVIRAARTGLAQHQIRFVVEVIPGLGGSRSRT